MTDNAEEVAEKVKLIILKLVGEARAAGYEAAREQAAKIAENFKTEGNGSAPIEFLVAQIRGMK